MSKMHTCLGDNSSVVHLMEMHQLESCELNGCYKVLNVRKAVTKVPCRQQCLCVIHTDSTKQIAID